MKIKIRLRHSLCKTITESSVQLWLVSANARKKVHEHVLVSNLPKAGASYLRDNYRQQLGEVSRNVNKSSIQLENNIAFDSQGRPYLLNWNTHFVLFAFRESLLATSQLSILPSSSLLPIIDITEFVVITNYRYYRDKVDTKPSRW